MPPSWWAAPRKTMGSTTSIVARPIPEVACVLPAAAYRDPLVRLALELRATYAGWGAIAIAPGMNSIKLALRVAAVRLGMPGLPDWWPAVPAIRLVELLMWLHEEDLPETFPPSASLRGLIEDAGSALAAVEAGL